MSERHDLISNLMLDLTHERRHVVCPLRPRVDVAPLTIAFAVTPQVDRVRAHTVIRHCLRESRVTT
jgi:hypothetical protein